MTSRIPTTALSPVFEFSVEQRRANCEAAHILWCAREAVLKEAERDHPAPRGGVQ
jgi:hypothetical protein